MPLPKMFIWPAPRFTGRWSLWKLTSLAGDPASKRRVRSEERIARVRELQLWNRDNLFLQERDSSETERKSS